MVLKSGQALDGELSYPCFETLLRGVVAHVECTYPRRRAILEEGARDSGRPSS